MLQWDRQTDRHQTAALCLLLCMQPLASIGTLSHGVFNPTGLLTWRAIGFAAVFCCFNDAPWSQIDSECTGPIFTRYSGLLGTWVHMINLTFIFRSIQTSCYGNQFLGCICKKWCVPPSLSTLSLHTGLDGGNADRCVDTSDDPSVSNKNLVNFDPVTPKFMRPNCVQQSLITNWVCFMTIRQKAWTAKGRSGYTLGFATHFSLT